MTGWDKEALKLEVENKANEGKIINWSHLPRTYDVKEKKKKGEIAKNGGQNCARLVD